MFYSNLRVALQIWLINMTGSRHSGMNSTSSPLSCLYRRRSTVIACIAICIMMLAIANAILSNEKFHGTHSADVFLKRQKAAASKNVAYLDLDDEDNIWDSIKASSDSTPVLTNEEAKVLNRAELLRRTKLSGFQFCPILDNATFDATVHIPALNGTIAYANPDMSVVVNAIDLKAWQIYTDVSAACKKMKKYNSKPDNTELLRVSCYFAAEGNSVSANFTQKRLLVSLDPTSYYKDFIPTVLPQQMGIPGEVKRRKYLVAYLLMVHEEAGFSQLTVLLDRLDDGDAIVMIHVDARPRSARLKKLLEDWIEKRRKLKSAPKNIFLSKHRFSNIWGHNSLVVSQLSGFWELLDIADWDFVINLSNYDFPLKTNRQVHRALNQDKYKGKNLIEYWPETDHLAERFYRVHLGESTFSYIFNADYFSVTSWPFPRWRAHKHHQWMIITPEFVKYLRTDVDALNFLAFSEHTYIPDESYFATVLLNSPEFKDTAINDNKRYLRFAGNGAAHPSWLGYIDRYLFPAYEVDPSFYFIRKLNAFGESFDEEELISWIDKHHTSDAKHGECTLEDVSVRLECLIKFVKPIADNGDVFVLPISQKWIHVASNNLCSLLHIGIKNVIYWSLDLEIHDKLITMGKVSILFPGFPINGDLENVHSAFYVKAMRHKPLLVKMILEAGFNMWLLDWDMVLVDDIRQGISTDKSTDVFVSILNDNVVLDPTKVQPSSQIMYFRNSDSSKKFVEQWISIQSESPLFDDGEALKRLITHTDLVKPIFSQTTRNRFQSLTYVETDDQEYFNDESDPFEMDQTVPSYLESSDGRIRMKYLDQFEFMDGLMLVNHLDKVPADLKEIRAVHTHSIENKQEFLSNFGLWFMNHAGDCMLDKFDNIAQKLHDKIEIAVN